jgi:cell wall-associated NlpC family hydrolase
MPSTSLKIAGVVAVLALLLSGCSTTTHSGAQAQRTPALIDNAGTPDTAYHPKRNDLALFALSLLDTPYSWGGRGPATGFDCSGLVSHVYREAAGLPVRGTSADLGKKTRPIDRSRIFNTLGTRHSHVGIYVGDGRFVHASNPRTGVRVDQLNNRYYAQRFEGAGTLLD